MYSVILLAAMTGPADAPAFGKLFKGGCSGCSGYACNGCTGCGGCVGCAGMAAPVSVAPPVGYACGGCGGCGGKFLGHKNGCWSTGGYKTNFACHGAGACYGYAYAGIGYGFAGCYGSCYGSHTNYFSYWNMPVDGGFAAPVPAGPMPIPAPPMGVEPAPKAPAGVAPPKPTGAEPPKVLPPVKPGEPVKPISAPANVIVSIPAEAKLLANGVMTRQTSSERTFTTPELEGGKIFHYTFTAEIEIAGKTITETRHVEVIAGHESRVSFGKLFAALSADPATIAGR